MTVHFIGAGPGAPDLMTIRGRDLIARCAVVLYAGSLVPEEVVAGAPEGARVIDTAPLTLDEIMAEETGGTIHEGRHWIIDPLDGTVYYVHGIPQVSVSVALYEGDTGLVGVVYDPLRDEIFTAVRDEGARLNARSSGRCLRGNCQS